MSGVAAALVMIHSVTWDIARRQAGTFIADAGDLVTIGTGKADVFRLSLIADMLGSYLLMVPAALFLWRLLRPGSGSIVDLITMSALVYAVTGAVAAAALAGAGEPLIREYASASPADARAVATSFSTLTDAAVATWQIVCVLAGGVWWIGVGLLVRDRWRWFARYSVVFGALAMATAVPRMAGTEFDSSAPATLAFAPIAVWIGWLGVCLWRSERDVAEVGDLVEGHHRPMAGA